MHVVLERYCYHKSSYPSVSLSVRDVAVSYHRALSIHVRHAVFVIKFNCFVYDNYLPIPLSRVVKCVTIGDVASGVAKCDLHSICNLRKNCGSFVDATSSES